MTTVTIEAKKTSRRIQKEVEERIRKLAPEVLADFTELVKMLNNEGDEHRAEIAKAITEILWPETDFNGLTDTEADEAEARKRVAAYRRQVGIAIRKRRTELGMTQEDLAKKSGLPQSHISRLEVGKHSASFTTMEKLAAALNTLPIQLDPGFPLND